jgi:spermidine synthase
MKPLRTIDRVQTEDGLLELKQRSERDFLITIDNRVLMTSTAHRSEEVLGIVACRRLKPYARPRVLIGGLGMGYTLRAVLDELPPTGQVVVAELNPVTEKWCRGPLALLTNDALSDPRVKVEIADVSGVMARAASHPDRRFDAIVIDLYVGPDAGTGVRDPLYGKKACVRAHEALTAQGIFGVWGEAYDAAFATRLDAAGFDVRHERPGKGGLRHVVYVAQKR